VIPAVHKLFPHHEESRDEVIRELVSGGEFRLEHIVSHAAASEPGSWYDQEESEWVVLIAGTATLEFEVGLVDLQAGEAILIPPRCRHRVAGTSADATWIALHFRETGGPQDAGIAG
jgi:cupin 2 domain-containing protein